MRLIPHRLSLFLASIFALASLGHPFVSVDAAERVYFDGDQAALRGASCVEYAELSQGSGRSGHSLRIFPDKWHAAVLNLFCGGERHDWSAASYLEFYIRSENPHAPDKDFWIESWNGSSQKVSISRYIDGGRIDSSWKRAVIPLADLASSSWNLHNVEKLFWGPDEASNVYYIDDIAVKAGGSSISQPSSAASPQIFPQAPVSTPSADPLVPYSPQAPVSAPAAQVQVSSPQTAALSLSVKTPLAPLAGAKFELLPVSHTVLKVIVPYKIDLESSKDIRNYELSSNTDPAYTSPKNPQSTGRITQVVGFEPNANYTLGKADKPLFESEIFLIFSEPLKESASYTLTIHKIRGASGGGFTTPQTLGFVWANNAYVTGTVKANQVGFVPKGPKYAYVGNYLGDAGALSVGAQNCEVRKAESGALVLTRPVRFRTDDAALSGEKVYDCDFSTVEAPGRYFISVPGYGRTYDFSIEESVYDRVFSLEHRLFYYQRDGAALSPAHAGIWARGAGHTETDKNAVIHESHKSSPLYNNEPINGTLDMRGGWFDAGDYGKYVITTPALSVMTTAFELFPHKFTDAMNIPESGNGVPDILDEMKWEIDWLRNMQASDGGVFDRVATTPWATTLPEHDRATRYVAPKTTHTTAIYAANLAAAYRVFKADARFEALYPGYADDLLTRAKKAWNFLDAHPNAAPAGGFSNPPGIGGGTYLDPEGDGDNRAWAAAELYKSTGDAKYEEAFRRHMKLDSANYGYNDFNQHWKKASWAYATTKHPVDQKYVDEYKKQVRNSVYESSTSGTSLMSQ